MEQTTTAQINSFQSPAVAVPVKYVLYARKSTESEDRQIQSIDDQIKYLKEMADRENLKISETIFEAKSAKEPYKRNGFTKLVSLIEAGKIMGIDVLLVNSQTNNPKNNPDEN